MDARPTQPRGDDVNLRSAPQMREYETIVARIVRHAPASILDWGCGLGQVSDLRLPYEDGRFGAVLSCGVLEHVLDPDASLDELARVLEPVGAVREVWGANRALSRVPGLNRVATNIELVARTR